MTYTWKDTITDTVVEVERPMAESNIPPDKPEAIEAGMSAEQFAEANWVKVITGGTGHVGWGMKGNW